LLILPKEEVVAKDAEREEEDVSAFAPDREEPQPIVDSNQRRVETGSLESAANN